MNLQWVIHSSSAAIVFLQDMIPSASQFFGHRVNFEPVYFFVKEKVNAWMWTWQSHCVFLCEHTNQIGCKTLFQIPGWWKVIFRHNTSTSKTERIKHEKRRLNIITSQCFVATFPPLPFLHWLWSTLWHMWHMLFGYFGWYFEYFWMSLVVWIILDVYWCYKYIHNFQYYHQSNLCVLDSNRGYGTRVHPLEIQPDVFSPARCCPGSSFHHLHQLRSAMACKCHVEDDLWWILSGFCDHLKREVDVIFEDLCLVVLGLLRDTCTTWWRHHHKKKSWSSRKPLHSCLRQGHSTERGTRCTSCHVWFFFTFFRFSSRSSFCRLLQVLFRYRYAEPIRHRAEVAACGLCDARQRERRRGEQTEANAKAVGGWDLGNGRLGAIKWVGTWNITFGKDTFQKIKSPLKMKYKTLRIKTDTAQLQGIIF